MVLSLKEQLRFSDENLFFLTENPDRDPSLATAKAVKSELIRVMDVLEAKARPNDLLFLLLLGHGNFDGSDYRYNLKGPDLTGSELSAILDRFPSQRIVLVCTTPASGAPHPEAQPQESHHSHGHQERVRGERDRLCPLFRGSFPSPER